MTSVLARQTNSPTPKVAWQLRWKQWRARNPESAVAALAVAAWVAMAVVHWANHNTVSATAALTNTADSAYLTELGLWSIMTIAMMVPGTLGMVRRLALDSLYARRQRNALLFTSVYVIAWTLVAAGFVLVERTGSAVAPTFSMRGTAPLVAALLGAAAWQVSDRKRRYLHACHLRAPLSPRGRAADLSVLRYARQHALACIGSCWLLMLAMFVADHDFHLMVPLAVITTYERFVKRPNHRASAAVLVCLAAMTALGIG